MKDLNLDFEKSPYQLNKEEKDVVFTKQMKLLTKYHREHCPEYDAMLTALDYDASKVEHYKDIPRFYDLQRAPWPPDHDTCLFCPCVPEALP